MFLGDSTLFLLQCGCDDGEVDDNSYALREVVGGERK